MPTKAQQATIQKLKKGKKLTVYREIVEKAKYKPKTCVKKGKEK